MVCAESFKNNVLQGTYRLFKENDKWTFGKMTDLNKNKVEKAKLKPSYLSVFKPKFRFFFHELYPELKSLGWDKKKLLIQIKFNGMRISLGVINKESFVYIDPEGLKLKSPRIDKKLPLICKELKEHFPNNTVLDAELVGIKDKISLHRTSPNSWINSHVGPARYAQYLKACVFDIIYYENKDLRNKSLEERLKYLGKLKSTDHILIASQTSNLARKAEGYIVDGSKKSDIEKAVNNIKSDKNNWGIKKISEGCMVKTMSGLLNKTQNPSQGKAKFLHEIDVRVFDRKQVKGSPGVYNYFLGIDINKDYAAHMLQDINARKHVIYLKDDRSYIKGKNAIEFLSEKYKPKLKESKKKWLVFIGKSDNHRGEYENGEIIRIVSEDVFWNKNETNPDYGFPTSYINIIREPVKEKNVTDPISYLYKLSQAEPQHISIEEIERMKIERAWQNLSKNEILNFNYINSEEGEINGEERKTKEKNSEISTARILSLSSEEKGQTEEKVNDIKEKEKEEKEVSYDGNGRKKAYEEKEKEGEKEGKKEKGKEGESTIIVGKETWLHLKCPSCNSNLSFPSIILNREKNIHCPWCNHNFLIKREDDS